MDMCGPYIAATKRCLPNARILFDRFHVMKHLVDAVDRVRRDEHRARMKAGDRALVGTKFLWLRNHESLDDDERAEFADLRRDALRVARAYAIKETARGLWSYDSLAWAQKAWHRWLSWARRSRLAPMVKAAKTVRTHLDGILDAVTSGISNAVAEAINSRIQMIKQRACGFRNRARFRNAIYFHLGGLDLYPGPNS
jgi:transposase